VIAKEAIISKTQPLEGKKTKLIGKKKRLIIEERNQRDELGGKGSNTILVKPEPNHPKNMFDNAKVPCMYVGDHVGMFMFCPLGEASVFF